MAGVDPAFIGARLRDLIAASGKRLVLDDAVTGDRHDLPLDAVADPAGLLPIFLIAGDAVWRDAAEQSFQCDLRADGRALLGHRVHAIRGGTFATILLCVLEAISQVDRTGIIRVNDLWHLWRDAIARIGVSHARTRTAAARAA